ncbi:MAG: hypothetical protein H6742_15325 [Alphaproteobacteria bacterium]|nr:hypothetical protein [Alphaproteobacteria bacterium]
MSFIKCYGMFWERSRLGELEDDGPSLRAYRRNSDQEPIDVGGQAGIYVLYDGDNISSLDVVYVGQAGRGSSDLLTRLTNHFDDRFWNRWTRFSWFGLYPVVDRQVQPLDVLEAPSVERAMDHLEAVLISLFEPPLNRQGGRWGADAVELYQWNPAWDSDEAEVELEDIDHEVRSLSKRVKKLSKRVKRLSRTAEEP